MLSRLPALIAVVFLVTACATAVPTVGWHHALAVTAGAAAQGCLAAAVTIAVRPAFVERAFGPLDQAYALHKTLGMGAIVLLIAHVALTVSAPALSPLSPAPASTAAFPLTVMGMVSLLLMLVAVVSALNTRLPYAVFQKVHGAAATAAVALITLHVLVSVVAGSVRAPVVSAWVLAFTAVSLAGVAYRLRGRLRRSSGLVIDTVVPRERAIELSWPAGSSPAHTPGQFVLLTATVDGRRETHPFTLTNRAGAPSRSVLVRAAGDWTDAAQRFLRPGDPVDAEGPYGAFAPGRSGEPEVWVAGGAGITPFLSVLRTAVEGTGAAPHPPVHLVYSTRDAADAPCWAEVDRAARDLPWLTLQPAFSAEGGHLDTEALATLAARSPRGAHWYLCGPSGLVEAVTAAYLEAGGQRSHLHTESYGWR